MRRFEKFLLLSAFVVLPVSAAAQAPDSAAVRAALNALNAKLSTAYLAGDAVTIASLYTEDARAEFAGFPSAVGRAAIQATYETYFKTNKLKVWESVINAVNSLSGDLATAGGTVHEFLDAGGKPAHGWWRWAAAYSRGADGVYRIRYVMAFPDSTK